MNDRQPDRTQSNETMAHKDYSARFQSFTLACLLVCMIYFRCAMLAEVGWPSGEVGVGLPFVLPASVLSAWVLFSLMNHKSSSHFQHYFITSFLLCAELTVADRLRCA